MNYEVVATLGPASAEEAVWQAMLSAESSAFGSIPLIFRH